MTDASHSAPGPVPVETLLTHRAWVRSLAWSLVRDGHLVDEVEQETWLRALRSPPREEAAARGWLATVVRNVVRNRFRSKSRRERHESAATPLTSAPAAADVVARADSQQTVVQTVMELDEPYRTTLLLRHFDGLPPREIAERMGVPVETVRTRTRRALERVRERLERRGGSRKAAFALLAPLLSEGPPPLVASTSGAATTAAAGSSVLAHSGALVMAMTGKKIAAALVAAAVLAGGTWVALSPPDAGPVGPTASLVPATDASGAESGPPAARGERHPGSARSLDSAADDAPDTPEEVVLTPVEVVLHDGSLARGVVTVAWPSGFGGAPSEAGVRAAVQQLPADDDGRIELEGTGAHEVLLWVPGRPGISRTVELGQGPLSIAFPAGRTVSGVVRVDGAAPREPLDLRLAVSLERVPIEIPDGVGPLVSAAGWSEHAAELTTDADGRFAFHGLPEVDTAWLAIPARTHEHATSGNVGMDVPVPARGLVLDFRARPRFRGRVVFEGGEAVAGAQIRVKWSSTETQGEFMRDADDEGRFELVLPTVTATEGRLRVSDRRSISWATVDLDVAGGRRSVGDVVLSPLREVQLRVVDASGTPVEQAVAVSGRTAERTDAEGLVTLTVAGHEHTLHFGALGYLPLRRTLRLGETEPVVVRLDPAPLLRIKVEGAGHDAGLRVRLSGEGSTPFTSSDGPGPHGLDLAAGATQSPGYTHWDVPGEPRRTQAWFDVDASKVVTLNSLRPAKRHTVELVDRLGTVHDRAEVRLGPTERSEVTLTARTGARQVTGVVRGPAGEPLSGAVISVSQPGLDATASYPMNELRLRARSDAEGRFSVGPVHTDTIDLAVEAADAGDGPSLVPWLRGALDTASATELDVTLSVGHTVRFRLVDASGNGLAGGWVTPEFDVPFGDPESFWRADEPEDAEPGTYELRGLPSVAGRLHVRAHFWEEHGSAIHELELDPTVADQTVVLGEPVARDRPEAE